MKNKQPINFRCYSYKGGLEKVFQGWWYFSWPLKKSSVFDRETFVGKISKLIQHDQSTSCVQLHVKLKDGILSHFLLAFQAFLTFRITLLDMCEGTTYSDQNQTWYPVSKKCGSLLLFNLLLAIHSIFLTI